MDLLDEWIFAAAASEPPPVITVAITFEHHCEAIANAVVLGKSNARLEAMNSTVRLISHRARGFRNLSSLQRSAWRRPRSEGGSLREKTDPEGAGAEEVPVY